MAKARQRRAPATRPFRPRTLPRSQWTGVDHYLNWKSQNDSNILLLSQDIVSEGLIAYWKFEKTEGTEAPDSAGENTGTLINVTDSVWIGGRVGLGAIFLDGVSDHMIYPNDILNRSVGSISHWLRPDQLKRQVAVYESDSTGSERDGFGTNGTTILEIHSGTESLGEVYFMFQRGAGNTVDEFLLEGSILPVSVFSHVAITWNLSGDAKIYIDGVLDVTGDMSAGTFPAMTTGVRNIGRVGTGRADRHWFGGLDDIRIYDREITVAEIELLAAQ